MEKTINTNMDNTNNIFITYLPPDINVQQNVNNEAKPFKHLKRLIIDLDDTALNSSEVIINILNQKYNLNKTSLDLKDYNYKSIYPEITKEELNEIYESDMFFSKVKFQEGFLYFCHCFKNIFSYEFLTKGTKKNIEKKYKYLQENFLYDFGFKGIGLTKNKSSYDMSNAILIDDVCKNFYNGNWETGILIKNFRETDYNNCRMQNTLSNGEEKNKNFYIVQDWNEIKDILEWIQI